MAGFDLMWPLQQQYAAAVLMIFTALQVHYLLQQHGFIRLFRVSYPRVHSMNNLWLKTGGSSEVLMQAKHSFTLLLSSC